MSAPDAGAPLGGPVAFRVEMLPAGLGDALVVTVPSERGDFTILVDTGKYDGNLKTIEDRLALLPVDADGFRTIDLFIVTHIDDDHIHNAVALLTDVNDAGLNLRVVDVWFNGHREMASLTESTGEADALSTLLDVTLGGACHNLAFNREPAQLPESDGILTAESQHEPPTREVGFREIAVIGDLAPRITLVSPLPQDLAHLGRLWSTRGLSAEGGAAEELEEARAETPVPATADELADLAAEPFAPSETLENICSIAILIENRGRALLLAGDGHPYVYEASLRSLAAARAARSNTTFLRLDAVKVAHHGSLDNTRHELGDLGATDYLVSTNGGSTYHHPNPQTMARLIHGASARPTFYFNYSTHRTIAWSALADTCRGTDDEFHVVQPALDLPGLVYELQTLPPV